MTAVAIDLPRSYLTEKQTVISWVFTTDHKRVALLFFASITFFFFIGGAAATLIRLHLVNPEGNLLQPDIYNRMFTMHGIVMVWFFLIPSIPTTLGNFLVPLMIGAHDLAFPRLNLASWYVFNLSGVLLLVTPVLAISVFLIALERLAGVGIFDPRLGGDPLLFQHLFWFYSHPAVYIMILPAMGIVSELVTCFARKPIFGYTGMTYALLAIAVFGFLVWGHHMFTAGISLYSGIVFSLMSFLVAVPSAIKVFNWTATLHKGSIAFDAPMLYALGFIGLFTMGGLTGLVVATLALDVHLTDTYFVIAHFHYIMVGGAVSAYFGGLHYWWPKITGRMYPEIWARGPAILMFLGFNLTFFPQFILGYLGMPRRYYAYAPDLQV